MRLLIRLKDENKVNIGEFENLDGAIKAIKLNANIKL